MRLIFLVLAVLLPFCFLGMGIGQTQGHGIAGLVMGVIASAGCLAYWASTAERTVIRSLTQLQEASGGVRNSVTRVTREELGLASPEIHEIAESAPNALIARLGGGAGHIILTQGLLATLTEDELRVVIRVLVLRLGSALLPRQTFCASLAHRILNLAPKGWTRFALAGEAPSAVGPERLGPQALLGFLLIYPWARFVIWCGNSLEGTSPPAEFSAEQLLLWGNAMRKVGTATQKSRFTGQPGLLSLYLCPPESVSHALSLV